MKKVWIANNYLNSIKLLTSVLYATYFSPLHYFRILLTEIPEIFMFSLSKLFFIFAIKYVCKLSIFDTKLFHYTIY